MGVVSSIPNDLFGGLAVMCLRRSDRPNETQDVHASPRLIPRHIAFIMDGNRRFGTRRYGVARRLEGHAAGGRKLGDVVDWCLAAGIAEVTVFAFSTENWHREGAEVAFLMRTFVEQCDEILLRAREHHIRCVVLCTEMSRLPRDVAAALKRLEHNTVDFEAITLNLAVSYGSRSEIATAARRLADRCMRGELAPVEVDECTLEAELSLISTPDLIVRTSGEQRLSNFLLWQAAYAELVFVEKHWPELEKFDFDAILLEYSLRKRRFGK